MARPNRKGPTKTVEVICTACATVVYKYRKGGKGALIKCFKERIAVDYTEKDGVCPGCNGVFARETMIRGVPAFKIIGGKATLK